MYTYHFIKVVHNFPKLDCGRVHNSAAMKLHATLIKMAVYTVIKVMKPCITTLRAVLSGHVSYHSMQSGATKQVVSCCLAAKCFASFTSFLSVTYEPKELQKI